jgi:predicted nucleic acid-binding protein
MDRYVTDTHALYWYLNGSSKLGPDARQAYEKAEAGSAIIYVPSIVMAELYYLMAKLGAEAEFQQQYGRIAAASYFRAVGFEGSDVLWFGRNAAVPEMHDRIIAGLAVRLGIPLLTRDPQIIAGRIVRTVW